MKPSKKSASIHEPAVTLTLNEWKEWRKPAAKSGWLSRLEEETLFAQILKRVG